MRVPAARYRPANAPERVSDLIAAEVPIALSYNGTGHVVMMASPADLHDFAVGFSIAEGMVAHPREIERVDIAPLERGIQVSIRVPTHRATAIAGQKRNLAGRTGCGLCGVTNIAQALRALPAIRPMPAIRAAAIDAALAELPRLQTINRETGAVHAAALADRDGRLILLREDVGRHNALDKMIGAALIRGLRPRDGFALVTSRCSMEMVQKAVTAGFPLLAAISAPTSLAIELANDSGLTLAAFARGKRFTLYANPEGVAP
ncbi:MAG: formate dehydrogenase accessory sulfurtransferase FdhD [Alphaproteobacteria bacterium]|nr:formate dehydrogenase accessory sulfurtransferase FdhD [Alphaproteobacteria bacterium]